MFGYVKTNRPELLIKEDAAYKSVYCALCRTLGKEYGFFTRFTLNYECTFLALLTLVAQRQESLSFEKKRCVCNPLKKCVYCKNCDSALSYAAGVSVILTYWKLQDNIEDQRFLRRFFSKLSAFFWRRKHRKAAGKYPEVEQAAAEMMRQQEMAENTEDFLIDRCADPTAKMLSAILSQPFEGTEKRILEELGYHLGRWIYFIDAADDLEEDLSQGSFNPFIREFSLTREQFGEKRREICVRCNEVLNFSISPILSALTLLPNHSFSPILDNILGKGLPEMQRKILFSKEEGKAES
ncbi:MAG: hypothetical protein II713_00270 [Clostridia bacterium]|nr:hypothetical protein [Clostridia bacterium]